MTQTNKFSEQEINNLFTRISNKYDLMNNVISLGTHKRWRRTFFKHLNVRKGDFCLDLCAGTGDLTIPLAKAVGPSGNVIGLDFNPDMLEIAQEKIDKANERKEIQLTVGDAMKLPYPDNSFDVVTIGFGLRNVPDATQVVSEVYRVLKPGGKFGILEMSKPTGSIVRIGWKAYFKIFPKIAKLVGVGTKDYVYLSKTTADFVSAKALTEILQLSGFKQIQVTKLNLGAAAIHIGVKPKQKAA